MKADDLVDLDMDDKENYTEFERLAAKVEVLIERFNELVDIFHANDIHKLEKVTPRLYEVDDVYEKLDDEFSDDDDN